MIRSKEVQSKQPNNGLLGTYFVSLFSVVLSCAMLFGTTYAWFNASSSSVGNVVETGELKVDMFHVTGENRISLSGNPEYGVFSGTWDPGEAKTATFEVYNAGDLPVHCAVYFVDDDNEVLSSEAKEYFWVSTDAGALTGEKNLKNTINTPNTPKPLFKTATPLEAGERQTFRVTLRLDDAPHEMIMNASGTVYLHLIAEQTSKP